MQVEMDRIVQSIKRTHFPSLTWEVNSPEEEDALLLLQEAIDTCAAQGGGTVIVHGGGYELDGTLHLKSNVNLHLEKDALLLFSGRGDDFLPVVSLVRAVLVGSVPGLGATLERLSADPFVLRVGTHFQQPEHHGHPMRATVGSTLF